MSDFDFLGEALLATARERGRTAHPDRRVPIGTRLSMSMETSEPGDEFRYLAVTVWDDPRITYVVEKDRYVWLPRRRGQPGCWLITDD